MKVLENKNNMTILENKEWTYFISYESVVAKVCNTIELNDKKHNNYGLYLTYKWDYSQTTLKQLYNFIELYTTQRDDTNNMIGYRLQQVNNKKQYIQQQLEKGNIKMIKEEEM